MNSSTGVGVLDKAQAILDALELGPHALADLAAATGLSRATAHRLARALESHRMLDRDADGRFVLGRRIGELAAADQDRLTILARPILRALRDTTGESAQLYRREGRMRRCVAVAELSQGLRDTVPLGATLTMTAGSAAQVLVAWEDPARVPALLADAAFDAATLAADRARGWAQSVGERQAGVASVSAPVLNPRGRAVAAMSVSGPIDRLGEHPGDRWGSALVAAAADLAAAVWPEP